LKLRTTVRALERELTIDEEQGWLTYFQLEAEDRKRALDEAKQRGRKRGSRA